MGLLLGLMHRNGYVRLRLPTLTILANYTSSMEMVKKYPLAVASAVVTVFIM